MKRLVYLLLMLGTIVGTVQGQVKNTDSLPPDSLLAHYYRILDKGTDKEVFLYASRKECHDAGGTAETHPCAGETARQ